MEIPMTSFIDFVMKSGSPKMTCAKRILEQSEQKYDPAVDYYKRFREAVQELHKKNLSKGSLSKLIGSLPSNKEENYDKMINGYTKFLGRKKTKWFPPVKKVWTHGGLQIPVNPELCLEWEEKKYFIKLYTKADKPSKDRISSILALMKHTIPTKEVLHAVLDVRNGKLYIHEKEMNALMPLVEGEAESLAFILGRI